jgi:hypothetical protein
MFSGWGFSQSNLKDCKESFLCNSDESFFSGLPDINNFSLCDINDHMESLNFSSDNFCYPKSFVHKFLSRFDSNESLWLAKEES